MRRCLIVAAAAGGLLLLGGAPASADPDPAGPLGGLLDPAGGIDLENPLDGSPVIKVKPGTNTPALPTVPGGGPAAPTEGGLPSARTGLGGADPVRPAVPAADAVKPVADDFAIADVPVGGVLNGGGLPRLGLMPDGSAPGGTARVASRESGLLGGVPLLGGLGGLLPEPARTLPADRPDTSGMPAGGTAVDPADTGTDRPTGTDPATSGPATSDPVTSDPATSGPAAGTDPTGPGDDDKRLHEEPIDDEAGGGRAFSDGRPVAGQDPDYK